MNATQTDVINLMQRAAAADGYIVELLPTCGLPSEAVGMMMCRYEGTRLIDYGGMVYVQQNGTLTVSLICGEGQRKTAGRVYNELYPLDADREEGIVF